MKYIKYLLPLLFVLYNSMAFAVLPTYDPQSIQPITDCNSGIWLKLQDTPTNTDGDPKIRPKGRVSGYAEIDPIKKEPSHLHIFSGPCDFTINSNRASLLNAVSGTTDGGLIDNTLVWQPALIDTRDGKVLKPIFFETYYSRGMGDSKKHLVEKTPKGFVFISGNHLATDYTQNDALAPQRSVFQCSAVTSGVTGKQDGFPLCANNAIFNVKVFAPQCVADDGTGVDVLNNTDNMLIAIDGKIYYNTNNQPGGLLADNKRYIVGGNAVLDSTDHRSHLVYAKTGNWQQAANECPLTHPHRIVQNLLIVAYRITNAAMMPHLKLSSDNGTQGASAHWDYMEGWNRMFYDIFYNECLMKGIDCGNAKLGNGWSLVNPNFPSDAAKRE